MMQSLSPAASPKRWRDAVAAPASRYSVPPLGGPEQLCAAYLADPWRTPLAELPWSACDAQRLLEVLCKNKVPLLYLPDLAASLPIGSGPLFQAAREAEAGELAALRAEYRLVQEALAAQGIAGVLCKSVGLQPSFPYKSDNLDVLYKPRDVDQVRATLRQLGYVELTNMEEPHKYLFRKFHAGRSVSAIHVHEHVGWMTSFLDEEKLWQRCRPAPDVDWITIPAPEDALLTVLAHWFYEDKRLTLQDVVKCAHCLRQGVDWDEIFRVASWRGWRDGLNAALLIYSYQEGALYGQTLVPASVLEEAWRGIPAWVRMALQRHLELPRWVSPVGSSPPGANGFAPGQRPGVAPRGERRPTETGLVPPRPEDSETLAAPGVHPALLLRPALLAGWAAAEGATMPLRIPFLFSKVFSYAKLMRDSSRSMARKVKDLAVHTAYGIKLRLHIHSQPAMLVTFSGVDGCGKTTQARALQSAFETCHLQVNYTWNRGGSARWIAFLNGWIRRRTGSAHVQNPVSPQAMTTEDKVHSRQQQLRHGPWKRWGWTWLTTIELLLQYTWRVTLPLLRGRVVICDRYVYDALADWSAYFGEEAVEKRLAARVLHLLTPRPRRAYWLDVPAQLAQARSSDGLPVHFLASQSAAYRRLAELYALRRPASDGLAAGDDDRTLIYRPAEAGWEEISDQVVYDVLSTYFSGYRTRINGLFLKNPGQWR